MAKHKGGKSTGKISSGNTAKLNREKEERRQAKFQRRKENGKIYEYKPNPFEKGTEEYLTEEYIRANKNPGRKDSVSRMKSIMRKLQNQLDKREREMKGKK